MYVCTQQVDIFQAWAHYVAVLLKLPIMLWSNASNYAPNVSHNASQFNISFVILFKHNANMKWFLYIETNMQMC